MTRYRSTSLKYFSRHCPKALDFYSSGEPMDRDFFAAGIAAHAILQDVGIWARENGSPDDKQIGAIADATAKSLFTDGRSFDGVPEPPLPPDAVVEGRDIALQWLVWNPPSTTAKQEIGFGMTADGEACAYDDPDARYVAILDLVDEEEIGDEEFNARTIAITDYKSAWPTDASELDTIQMRGQAVLVELANRGKFDLIVRRAANLRTRQVFEAAISPEEERETLEQWKRDILALCDAADKTREARPGAGCGGCPWVSKCPDTWDAIKDPSDVVLQFSTAQAVRDDLFAMAKLVCKESLRPIPGGAVGYHAQEIRKPHASAYRDIAMEWFGVLPENADQWAAENSSILGLLSALDLGKSQLDSVAKALHPERGTKIAREEFIERMTEPFVKRQFGVKKVAA